MVCSFDRSVRRRLGVGRRPDRVPTTLNALVNSHRSAPPRDDVLPIGQDSRTDLWICQDSLTDRLDRRAKRCNGCDAGARSSSTRALLTDGGRCTEQIGERSAPIDERVCNRSVASSAYRSATLHRRSVAAASQIGRGKRSIGAHALPLSSPTCAGVPLSPTEVRDTEPIGEQSAPIDEGVCN